MEVALLVALSAAFCWISMLLLVHIAPRLGLLDHPGGHKAHTFHTPVVGGLAMFVALLPLAVTVSMQGSADLWWFCGSFAMVVLGLWDDISNLSAAKRLVLHIASGAFLLLAGIDLTTLGNLTGMGTIALGALGIPLTLFAVAASINSTNMVDGVDGLLGALCIVPLSAAMVFAMQAGLAFEATLAASLLASTFVFLVFNFRFPWAAQARVFMGDAGSTLMGFNLAWLLISLSEKSAMPPVLALYFLAIPLLDTAGVIVRRRLKGVSAATPGHDHLHHVLLKAGFSVPSTVLIIMALSVIIAALGMLAWRLGAPESVLFAAYLLLFVAYIAASYSVEKMHLLIMSCFSSDVRRRRNLD